MLNTVAQWLATPFRWIARGAGWISGHMREILVGLLILVLAAIAADAVGKKYRAPSPPPAARQISAPPQPEAWPTPVPQQRPRASKALPLKPQDKQYGGRIGDALRDLESM